MRLSVIVPAHNEEGHIGECIDSIQSQTHKDVELIVVCDSCSDDTVGVARRRGISPLEVNFSSTGLAQNAGLEVATGDYFMCMGADDYFSSPDALKILHDRLATEPTDVLSFAAFFGSHIASCYYSPGQPWPNVSFNLFRSDTFKGCRFPDSSYCEDRSWFNKNVKTHHSIGFIDIPVYQYRYPRAASAIGMHHRHNVESMIAKSPELASTISQLQRIPIRFDREDPGGAEFIIRTAADMDFLLQPTLLFLTKDPVCADDLRVLRNILRSLSVETTIQFDVDMIWASERAAREEAWGISGSLGKMTQASSSLLSLRILHIYSEINRRELESTARNVILTTEVAGLPRSHAEAVLHVVSQLAAATGSDSSLNRA